MIGTEEIMAGVQLNDPYQYILRDASVDERLGFLTMQAPFTSPRHEILIGFGVPGRQSGNDELPVTAHSITEFDEVPKSQRTLDDLHMGVGIRLYNTWQAVTVLPENFQNIGAYMVAAEMRGIRNLLGRPTKGTQQFDRILQLGMASSMGLKNAIRAVEWFRQGDLTLHVQEERVSKAQKEHRKPPLEGIKEKVAVVRNPQLVLSKIGEVSLEQVT